MSEGNLFETDKMMIIDLPAITEKNNEEEEDNIIKGNSRIFKSNNGASTYSVNVSENIRIINNLNDKLISQDNFFDNQNYSSEKKVFKIKTKYYFLSH